MIKEYAKKLKLEHLNINADSIIEKADVRDISYQDLLLDILQAEINLKDKKAQERRIKNAGFPVLKTIEEFDLKFQRSITNRQINRLLEMEWIDRMYNLIFLGPPGVGKTHLSIALGYKAATMGYKVSFITMDKLMHCLKLKRYQERARVK